MSGYAFVAHNHWIGWLLLFVLLAVVGGMMLDD